MTIGWKHMAGLAALAPAFAPADAAVVVDVDNLLIGPRPTSVMEASSEIRPGGVEFYHRIAQSWTPTRTGRLAQIDLYSQIAFNGRPPAATLNVYGGDFLTEKGSDRRILLGSRRIPLGPYGTTDPHIGVPVLTINAFTLEGTAIDVVAGVPLTFEFLIDRCRVEDCYRYIATPVDFVDDTSTRYSAGRGYETEDGRVGDPYRATSADMNFRTWVDLGKGNDGGGAPPAVPEPGNWVMMAGGFAAIGCMLRRRRNAIRAV